MEHVKLSTLISEKEIKTKVKELGQTLTDKFHKKDLVTVCILKGSFIFYADLVRAMEMDLACEFFGVSSYHGETKTSGEVNMTLDLQSPIEDKHVLLIEDIVDTGLTMNYLIKNLTARCPKSLTTCSLLLKPDALKVPLKINHVGFKISDEFVVGYGLDYRGMYRNLPYIAQVQNIN